MSAAEGSRQIVVFGLGEEEYAVAITEVQEIIRYVQPRSVASDADWIRGVISLRGKIIPVCDLATRLGVTPGEGTPAKIIVVAAADHTIGLIVDDVTEVLSVSEDEIETLPLPSADTGHAIAKVGERLIVLLASARVFDTAELADAA